MKKIFLSLIFILFIMLINILIGNNYVFAADEFTLDKTTMDVKLNGRNIILYSGGTGTVTWESSDTSIATVSDGSVTGLKIGTTTITATRGSETKTCTVNVVYNSLSIGANSGKIANSVNLVLDVHESEFLKAEVKDYTYTVVDGASVEWTSSDTSIATVNSLTGELKALKEGTTTITATAAGVTNTCKVNVFAAPEFTDFSQAKYETTLEDYMELLKISNVIPKSVANSSYNFIITSDDKQPTINLNANHSLSTENQNVNYFLVNSDENYLYTRKLAQYAELNQDMYIWIIESEKLDDTYYDEDGKEVYFETKFVVEGKKIERAELPQLNLILKSIFVFGRSSSSDDYTHINFNFPSNTENRKFKLKIGKVTDTSILNKVKNGDYQGIVSLNNYAKSADTIYSQDLVTTDIADYRCDSALFDGKSLLDDYGYYFIYAQFDDEDGKYYPIEGVTLAQAWKSKSDENNWDLYAYTSDNFSWDNLTPSSTDSNIKEGTTTTSTDSNTIDGTTATQKLPYTGRKIIELILLIFTVGISFVLYKKEQKYKGI